MRLAVATAQRQVQDNDFNWCIDGELVLLGEVCGRDLREPDGGCGCGRSFSGLNSQRATTTAEIRNVDISLDDLTIAVQSYLQQAGWSALGADDDLQDFVDQMVELGEAFEVGTLLERRLEIVRTRQ